MKEETRFQIKVLRELKKFPKSWFEKISQRVTRGTPDILGCVNGHFVALELKSKKGKTAPLQSLKLMQIALAGGHSAIVSAKNWEEVRAKLWSLLEEESSGSFCLGKSPSQESDE